MDDFSVLSVVVPTRDRPKALVDLLLTLLNQSSSPLEIIIVDDSFAGSAERVTDSLKSRFQLRPCSLRYVRATGDGLPAARNLGIKTSHGDFLFFLDDDTLLDQNVVSSLAMFMRDNPTAVGVQPRIISPTENHESSLLEKKVENAVYKAFMLSYFEKNKLAVRRSGASIFPNDLTKVISAQRLSGCCCYKREVFKKLSFDTNLKRWGFAEDLDFSYRVHKMYPHSLYVVPYSSVIHKASGEARLQTKLTVYMTTTYWFYVFFKDVFEGSILNLMAFLWALSGNLVTIASALILKKKSKTEWWRLIFTLSSYAAAFRNLKSIRMLELEFFNRNL